MESQPLRSSSGGLSGGASKEKLASGGHVQNTAPDQPLPPAIWQLTASVHALPNYGVCKGACVMLEASIGIAGIPLSALGQTSPCVGCSL